jgi:alanine racemase
MTPAHNPRLDIDLAALCANYRRIAAACPAAEAAAVVKCDGYGLGAAAVGRALAKMENCRTFFVAYSEEGEALREAVGPMPRIFVFNGPLPEYLPAYRAFRLTPVINTLDQARLWAREAPGAPAALHFDTGMHRLGLSSREAGAVLSVNGLNIELVMSHLACASDPAHPMNAAQRAAFAAIAAKFPAAQESLASSGGALISEAFGCDQVRLGVGLYGASPLDERAFPIEPVARLTAPVIQVHEMGAGETVGYGATFTADRALRLATVALGYGDGFPRAGSNRAKAHLQGALCPVVGRVSMDLIVLDVTTAHGAVNIGDRAEFFGPTRLIDDQAADCGVIGYELLTGVGGLARPRGGLGGRVERRYLWGDRPAETDLVGDEGKDA